VDEVIVFGRTPEKLAAIGDQFGFTTTTNPDSVISDHDIDLVDICLPTRMHADIAAQAMLAGRDVLIELPLASSLDDARRIVAIQ
jgi:predicted dehydrogenase